MLNTSRKQKIQMSRYEGYAIQCLPAKLVKADNKYMIATNCLFKEKSRSVKIEDIKHLVNKVLGFNIKKIHYDYLKENLKLIGINLVFPITKKQSINLSILNSDHNNHYYGRYGKV